MNEVVDQIYATSESELKAVVLRMEAGELKEAALSLGVELSASGRPVEESTRFDNALAIKATQGAEESNKEESVSESVEADAPSIVIEGKKEAAESAKVEKSVVYVSVKEAEKRVLRLRKELKEATDQLAKAINDRAKNERKLTQNDLINIKRKRQKIQ